MFIIRIPSKARNILLITLLLIFISWKPEVFSFLYLSYSEETWKLPNSTRVIAFSPNREMLAIPSGSLIRRKISVTNFLGHENVEIRNVTDGSVIQTIEFFSALSLTFSPDNKLIAIGGYKGEIKIYRIEDGELVRTFKANNHPSSEVFFLAFTNDGQTLITRATGFPGQITFWGFTNGKQRYSISNDKLGSYKCNDISVNSKFLVLNNKIQPLNVYQNTIDSFIKKTEDIKGNCHDIEFSLDRQIYVVFGRGSEDTVKIFNLKDNKLIKSVNLGIYESKELPNRIDLSPDGRYVAVAFSVAYTDTFWRIPPSRPKASHGRIRIWNTTNGRLVATLRGHKRTTSAIAFSPDDKWLASAGRDSTIKLWRMPPRNYRIWLLAAGGLAALIYWRRNHLRD